MRPAVSILVPICNVQKYLRVCVDSLVNQTLQNIEIILINDGSKDDSLSIIREFERRDSRIVVIDKPNSGYGDSMNKALALASGEYVGIVESDDFASLDMFERLYSAAKQYDAEVVKSNYVAFSTTGDEGPQEHFVENLIGCPYDMVFRPIDCQNVFLCQPAIWSGLYKKSFLERNEISFLPTPGASFQDTGFCFKLLFSAERAVLLRDGFLHYRIDNDGSSVKSQAKIFPICEEYAEIWRYARRDKKKFNAIKRRIPYQQFGGYRWNLERLVPQIRPQFYKRMIDEFRQISAAGLLDRSFFDKLAWDNLSEMLDDPAGYYRRMYGPVEVRGSIVACLSGTSLDEAIGCLQFLLDVTGESDEIILVHEHSSTVVDSLKASDVRGARVFDDSDLITSSLLLKIDPSRIRGSRVAILCGADGIVGLVSQLNTRGGIFTDSRSTILYEGTFLITDTKIGLLETIEEPEPSLPILVLGAAQSSNLLCPIPNMGICDKPVGTFDSKDYGDAVESLARFSREFIESSGEYEFKRSIYYSAIPMWNRVRKAFSLLSGADSDDARPFYESMALVPALVLPSALNDKLDAPELTVIVPVYNVLDYLDEAVDSILMQDVKELEVLFINDGSTDGSLDKLERIARVDSRVRVVSQFNCGAGAARNRGISLARGRSLVFIDPDDFYPNEHVLRSLLDGMYESGSLMCGGSFSLFLPTGEIQESFPFAESFYSSDSERDVPLEHVWNDYGWIRFVYDVRIFSDGSVRFPQLNWYEDPVFFMRAVDAAGGYHLIPDVVYRYRVGYKETEWTPPRVRDLLIGVEANLKFAARHEMAELYTTLIGRLEIDYYWPIMRNISDRDVFLRLLSIQSTLKPELILPARDSGARSYCLKPLTDLAPREIQKRDTAIVRLAHKVESSSLYEGIQRVIWRAKGQDV